MQREERADGRLRRQLTRELSSGANIYLYELQEKGSSSMSAQFMQEDHGVISSSITATLFA